jgi:nitrate reductase gamma subunit
MNITIFTKPKSILTITLAVLMLLQPNWVFMWFGMILEPAGQVLGRILGAMLLIIGFGLFTIRSNEDLSAKEAGSLAVTDAIAVLITAQATISGVMNPLGWMLVLLYASSGLGFWYCLTRVKALHATQ